MKLILAIVNQDDSNPLVGTLTEHGYRSTVLSTMGGFLRQGNSTVLIGTDEERLEEVLDLIKQTCHTRTETTSSRLPFVSASEVRVGGATVFVVEAEKLHPLLMALGDSEPPCEGEDAGQSAG